jgi:hypothetical protein
VYDTHREPGSPSLLPTPNDVEAVLNLTEYGGYS